MYTEADLTYIRATFVPLPELCAANGVNLDEVRAAMRSRSLPAPPYEGIDYVPANYFDLPDAQAFRRTFRGDELEAELEAYLDGTYFVCLHDATVANIARKAHLVDTIRAMLAEPDGDDASWRRRLHERVDELDVLERPFSPDFDRTRFGRPPTRDELIDGARRHFPRDRLFATEGGDRSTG